jgi:hypothetical protein
MDNVYVGQDSLRIELDTGVDLSTALSVVIKFIKPDGTTGSWTGTVSETKVYYDFTSTATLAISGIWTVWAYATFADSRVAAGAPAQFTVKAEGS